MHALAMIALVIWGISSSIQEQVKTEVFQLRFCRPTKLLFLLGETGSKQQVNRPASPSIIGIKALRADNESMTVRATGTPGALAEFKNLISLLDVVPRLVKIDITVTKVDVTPDGTKQEEVINSLRAVTKNNEPLRILSGIDDATYRIDVTPRVNGDESITTFVEFSIFNAASGRKNYTGFDSRVKADDQPITLGLADAEKLARSRDLDTGKYRATGSFYSVYLVQIHPVAEPRK